MVRVVTCRENRDLEPAPVVPKEQRGEVWARWLAEGRYRSGAELARAGASLVPKEWKRRELLGAHKQVIYIYIYI